MTSVPGQFDGRYTSMKSPVSFLPAFPKVPSRTTQRFIMVMIIVSPTTETVFGQKLPSWMSKWSQSLGNTAEGMGQESYD